jgi:hypothetical protein
LYGITDKSFSSNGDYVLHPFKAEVKKEDNGDFALDLQTGLEYVDQLVVCSIICSPS